MLASSGGIIAVRTDLPAYAQGASVNLTWTAISLQDCTCQGPAVALERKAGDGWEAVPFRAPYGSACIDGRPSYGMPCDAVMCRGYLPHLETAGLVWDGTVYEPLGMVTGCGGSAMPYFQRRDAIAGVYRFSADGRSASFRIV